VPRPPRQRQLPVSPDEILPKAVVRLLFNQTKAGRLIANAFADKTAPDPERVCLWEPESKIGPSCLRDSFFFDQSEYAALPVWLVTMWLFAFTRTQATNYDFFGGIVYVT